MHTGASYRRSWVITGPSHLGVYGPCVFIRCVIEKAKKTAQLGSKSSAFDGRVLLGLDRLGLNPVSQRHVTSGSCAGVWLIGCDPTDETDRCCSECGAAGRVRSSWRRRLYLVKSMFRVSSLIFYIETPKTKCGIRKVPMSEEAGKALQRVLKRKTGKSIQIDGYRNFLFLNQKGMPMVACNYTSALKNIVKKYNKYHEEPLPKITPHILRHTFCTRLAQKNMNPKNLQYIMGHSSIMITLNLYAHASQTGANMEMRSLIA